MVELLAKYFSGNVSLEERTQVETWRNESEQNAAEFFEYASLWNDGIGEVKFDKQSALANVMSKINATESIDTTKVVTMTNDTIGWKSYLRYAAVILLGLGLAFYFYNGNEVKPEMGQTLAVVQTADRELQEIKLPDGSVVYLSERSNLSYQKSFDGKTREVELEGKAFFEIKRDESRPFIVRTEESEVTVLGTSFLVNTKAADDNTEVVVATGKVAVAKNSKKYKNDLELVELTPGEKVTIEKNAEKFTKVKNSNSNFLSWKTSIIEFDKVEMRSVIETLKDVYHVNINVSDQTILNCKLSAKFDHKSINSVMEIISHTFGLELVKISKYEYNLNGQGCFIAQ